LHAAGFSLFFLALKTSKAAAHRVLGDVDPFNVMVFLDDIFEHRKHLGSVSFFPRAPQNGDDFHDNSPFLKLSLQVIKFPISRQY